MIDTQKSEIQLCYAGTTIELYYRTTPAMRSIQQTGEFPYIDGFLGMNDEEQKLIVDAMAKGQARIGKDKMGSFQINSIGEIVQ